MWCTRFFFLSASFRVSVFLLVLQEIWNTSSHLLFEYRIYISLRIRLSVSESTNKLSEVVHEICLPCLLYIFLCISLSVERKYIFNFNQRTRLQKISCWESIFSRMTTTTILKNRSRNTCAEYRGYANKSQNSRHTNTHKNILNYSLLLITFCRNGYSCYWMW
jgi:hypothetical protein